MKWPSFENKIKEKLSSHRSEVDVNALWSAIEPEVDAINQTKRKRRFGFLWLALAGALLLGSGASVYYFLNNDKDPDHTVIADINSTPPTNIEEKEKSNTAAPLAGNTTNKKETKFDQPPTIINDVIDDQSTTVQKEKNIKIITKKKNQNTISLPSYF